MTQNFAQETCRFLPLDMGCDLATVSHDQIDDQGPAPRRELDRAQSPSVSQLLFFTLAFVLEAATGLPPLPPILVAPATDVGAWFLPSLFLSRSLPAFLSGTELPTPASGPAPTMRDVTEVSSIGNFITHNR